MTQDVFVETPRKLPEEKDLQRLSRCPVRQFDWLFVSHLPITPVSSLPAFMARPNLGLNQNG